MIVGILHKGSGLGDQLFTYILTRTIALDKGYEFGFVGKEHFKGVTFMSLDWGQPTSYTSHIEMPAGRTVIDDEHSLMVFDTPYYNPEVNFVPDWTVIDGYGAQDERYFGHRMKEIAEWLKVKEMIVPQDICIINFRGGEFAAIPELFLTKEYWEKAIAMMEAKYPGIAFEVHTDDLELAKQFFPDYFTVQNIAVNWRSIRYAKHLIVSNSAFAIMPALLGKAEEVIAPRGWARRNIGQWSMPANYYRKFTYI